MTLRSNRSAILLLAFGTVFAAGSAQAQGYVVTGAVWGDFANTLVVPPGTADSEATAFYSGHVSDAANAPYDGAGFELHASSMGEMVSASIPYPGYRDDIVNRSLDLLYYEHASSPTEAAFRYKTLLYGESAEGLSARFDTMGDHWGDTERARAWRAANLVMDALKYDPRNTALRNILLDTCYDIAVADVTFAADTLVEVQKAALGPPLGPAAPPGEFLISNEISLLEGLFDQALYEKALLPYMDLLNQSMGVNMASLDPAAAAAGIPFGYYLFEEEVPQRSLFAPLYKDNEDVLQAVSGEIVDGHGETLFAGYKDLVLLFNIERDMARAAAKLAKLYALRAIAGDMDKARQLIGAAQQKSYTDGEILNGIFSAAQLAGIDQQSGFVEARASWGQGLSALSGVKAFLDGEANPLGLDKDFVALVQTDLPGVGGGTSDSYDYFANILLPDGLNPSGPLGDGYQKYVEARDAYVTYRTYQDQIAGELTNQRRQFADRLRAIAGAEYPDPPDPTAEYHTPEDNEGGEIYLQMKSIEMAKLRIEQNATQIDNLQKQVENEIERRGKEHGINDLISKTYIKYGDKQAKLTQRIGQIQAVQSVAVGVIEGFSLNPAKWGREPLVGAVQAAGAIATANVNAQKERLTAAQSAEIHMLNDQISEANSAARVKDLLLGMETLAIESQQAVVSLSQEMGRLQALLDEKEYLEKEWANAEADLATRYFADPVHRIIADTKIIESDFAFSKAQLWVFIMARALDYKWNTQVVAEGSDGRFYTAETVFGLRNSDELVEMAKALWTWNAIRPIGIRGGDQFVKFSLRDDFLGFRRTDYTGAVQYYPDPHTGEMVTGLEAFRSYLRNVATRQAPTHVGLSLYREVVHLEFSTNRPNFAGTFFSPGRWNEKIKWVAVNINATSGLSELSVYLEQSGMGYVRNQVPGVPNPDYPDRTDMVLGEMTAYPTKYWYQEENPLTHVLEWRSKDSFGFTINAMIARDPDAPLDSLLKKEFHEMPPAVSTWSLEIPTIHTNGQPVLDLSQVQDVEIWFLNYYKVRN